ncbi:MAG: CUAEP/CCAEP-tail radical SAM (seleno)protein [Pseudonocardiaceae bacterium]
MNDGGTNDGGTEQGTGNVVLISTYEMGRQPFGVASPAAWLEAAGAFVTCMDLAIEQLDEQAIGQADLIACYVPMHMAGRLATSVLTRVREINPRAHLCCYGLYAPANEQFFRELGAELVLGGEFEQGLVDFYRQVSRSAAGATEDAAAKPVVSLARLDFIVPKRDGLPALDRYARLNIGDGSDRLVGYTEATRGCKHLCRHCPVVPVYGGRFRVVPREVVLEDIRRQVAAGAQHITFGDPDFFNAPGHALPLVEGLHREFPQLSYDVTIKIEHLVKGAGRLRTLRRTGCLFVTSAVESFDDAILERFDKRHTHADVAEVVRSFREVGLHLSPTFVTFTPWTTLRGYVDLLETIFDLGLVDSVAPVQYAIRLLIPAGSELLELSEVRQLVEEFDPAALYYPWKHPDPAVDRLYEDVLAVVANRSAEARSATFADVWELAHAAYGAQVRCSLRAEGAAPARATVPYLNEPWYC